MKNYLKPDEWLILEEGFEPENNRVSESIFSIGNGKMGQRANFEEKYTGDSLQGSYIAGVYYPDKTRVGWWKNGYPEYFAKVPNATNWIGFNITIDGIELDLATCKINHFSRELNMKEGYLKRKFEAVLPNNEIIQVQSTRFCSLAQDAIAAIEYKITPVSSSANINVEAYLDGNIKNEDANYDELFWDEISQWAEGNKACVAVQTRKTLFDVATAMQFQAFVDDTQITTSPAPITLKKYAALKSDYSISKGQTLSLYKYVANLSSMDYDSDGIENLAIVKAEKAAGIGFEALKKEQAVAWSSKWDESDITITGDVSAQQAIRFNIFQLNQTYSGNDARLNIGPKGFTGEKYGGSTYWDTEAYCLPFYQATASEEVARNLLIYRYNHLPKAIENAEKLGFKNGAALYPMVTMNGEECHNEWEITFEEIHRNGAIAYAIYDYVKYTGDKKYIADYGLEVLIGIARFWAQRITFSKDKQKFVMLGVTGPNEFENNVNNNWYTNKIACWCLVFCAQNCETLKLENFEEWQRISKATEFDENELIAWKEIITNMYYPFDEKLNIFLQQDGFLDKEQVTVNDLLPSERPIVEHWSWDRILRSIFIKQADVLQGIYFFEDEFNLDSIKRHFDYYEPRTVHESSLSPCVHSILAAKIGDRKKAYEFYLRTARLDLDNYNNDTKDGLHITSMAGTWLTIVKGFAGMRVVNDELNFTPFLPEEWKEFSFKVRFRNAVLKITVSKAETKIEQLTGDKVKVKIIENNGAKKGVVAH
jgi:maltose phosphorylase